MSAKWTAAELPDQSGRTFIVTGATSGLGLVTARELARVGARVVLAVRDPAKGERVAALMPGHTEVRRLDLAELASVRGVAAEWAGPLDVLINLLLPQITSRVVTVSSQLHRRGRLDLDDLNWEHRPAQRQVQPPSTYRVWPVM